MSNATSQSQSAKHDTGTWRAANGSSGANYDNLGTEAKNSRADLAGRVQNGEVYYTGIDVYQTKNTSTNNTGSGFALRQTTNSHTVGSTQTTETRGGNSGSWYGSKLESGNSTTNYTTVSGTMGQPFSGMTQTGFNITTLYGTAAQTGISGMYGQTGTGGSFNTLQTGGGGTTSDPVLLPSVDGTPNYLDSSKNIGRRPEPNAIYNAYIFSAYKNKEYIESYLKNTNLAEINLQKSLSRIYYAKITGQLENRDTTPKELDDLDKSLRLGIAGLAIYGGGSNLSGPQALAASAVMIGQTLPAHLAEKGVEFAVEGVTQNALGKFAGALFNASKGIYRLVGGKLHKIIRKGGVEVAETISENDLNKIQKFAKNFSSNSVPKTFSSFGALKRGLGSPGDGNVWHHVVEQRLVGNFGASAIHNSDNVVAVSKSVNQAIVNYYSSIPRSGFTGGRTVRQWLGIQSFADQSAFGRRILEAVLNNQILP